MESYERSLEKRIEQLERIIEEDRRAFHIPYPGDILLVKKDIEFETRSILSFNRGMVKKVLKLGNDEQQWLQPEPIGSGKATYDYEWLSFIIPEGTKLEILNYEVKKRKAVDYNYIKFKIVECPVKEYRGSILRFDTHNFIDFDCCEIIHKVLKIDKIKSTKPTKTP